jgi:hypothetical protein
VNGRALTRLPCSSGSSKAVTSAVDGCVIALRREH